jgi:hypothetical protein
MSGTCGIALTIDGFCCADQFAGVRLTSLGLIATTGAVATPPQLTPTGRALLAA